jgi:hypothetical protein
VVPELALFGTILTFFELRCLSTNVKLCICQHSILDFGMAFLTLLRRLKLLAIMTMFVSPVIVVYRAARGSVLVGGD